MIIGYLFGVSNDVMGVANTIYLIPLSLALSLGLTIVISIEVKRMNNKFSEEKGRSLCV